MTSLKINRIYPYIQVLCHLSLELIFKAKLKLESGNQKIQYGCLAAILKLTLLKINKLLHIYISIVLLKFGVDIQSQSKVSPETKKSNMAARQPFWKWCRWKSIGSYPYIQVLCHWSLELIFKAKLNLESGNQKIQYGCQAAILKLTLLKVNKLLHIYISIVLLKFGVDIQSQTKVSPETKKSNMATRRPFWKWRRWKSIGFCLWPPSTCIWSLKLKFQSKLDLHSGNHVT